MGSRIKIREEAKKLNPMDDLLFRKMSENRAFCEEILQVILSDPGLAVLECTPQYDATNLQGRSAVFDARCILGSGKQVIIEVQKADDDDHQKRMRYNGALLTANTTDPGERFQNVPDICAVFISRFDIFQGGLPLYHVDRVIRENGKAVDNGFEEVYVNAKIRDGSEVSELMEVFVEDNAYNDKFPVTSGIKRRFKETEEGQEIMCEIMEKIRSEAKAEGRKEGREEGREEGRACINRLHAMLIDAGRYDDLKRSTTDINYQTQLMHELLPEETA